MEFESKHVTAELNSVGQSASNIINATIINTSTMIDFMCINQELSCTQRE